MVVQCVGLSCSLPTIAFLSDGVGGGQYGSLIQFTCAKLFCQSRQQMLKALARKFSEAQRTLFIIFPMASTVFFIHGPPAQFETSELVKKEEDNRKKNPNFFSFLLLRKGYHQKRFTKKKNSECLIIRTAS